MILMIDNYDSFTYNLVQYMGELGAEIRVERNDRISIPEIESMKPKKIVISPGPCTPAKAGISVEAVKHFSGKVPLLGVCLGHQSVGAAFGGEVIKAGQLMHGKTSEVRHDGKTLFKNLPNPITATRYHSLVLNRKTLPECFEITAESDDNEIMGIRHKQLPVEGVQFHPESIFCEGGHQLLENFFTIAAETL